MKPMPWFVPEFNEALPCWRRIATVELVWDGARYKIQVVPFTNGDIPYSRIIAAAPDLLFAAKQALMSLEEGYDAPKIRDDLRDAIKATEEYNGQEQEQRQ